MVRDTTDTLRDDISSHRREFNSFSNVEVFNKVNILLWIPLNIVRVNNIVELHIFRLTNNLQYFLFFLVSYSKRFDE